MVLGLKPEQVRVIYTRGSGCYGLNGADAVSYDAAILSQKHAEERMTKARAEARDLEVFLFNEQKKRDEEVAKKLKINMVLTGERHFRH